MRTLSYQDALELLGYVPTKRRWLEILGYEYSTRGMKQFRAERPDFLPQLSQLIAASLEETGTFPRGEAGESHGVSLERRPEGVIRYYSSAEISVFETIQVHEDFDSMPKAIATLLRRTADPAYANTAPTRES